MVWEQISQDSNSLFNLLLSVDGALNQLVNTEFSGKISFEKITLTAKRLVESIQNSEQESRERTRLHDIASPLSAILLNGEMIAKRLDTKLNSEQKKFVLLVIELCKKVSSQIGGRREFLIQQGFK